MPDKKDTRQYIVEKSLGLFFRRGYEGCSLSDICKATKLTKGAVYHYFVNKQALYQAAVEAFFLRTSLPSWVTERYTNFRDLVKSVFQDVDKACKWIRQMTGVKSDNAILHFNEFLYEATRRYPEYQKRIDLYDEKIYSFLQEKFMLEQVAGRIYATLNPRLLAIELYALQQQLIYLRFVNPALKRDPSILNDLAEHFLKKIEVGYVR